MDPCWFLGAVRQLCVDQYKLDEGQVTSSSRLGQPAQNWQGFSSWKWSSGTRPVWECLGGEKIWGLVL